jgi:SAM-dependent methyltransferase
MNPDGPNAEQIAYWNDQAGLKWVRLQEQLDAMIEPLGLAAIERAEPAPNERVLDVGCGCGASSLDLAERVGAGGEVLGVDLSSAMLERAQARARDRQLTSLRFAVADAQSHRFDGPGFDLVFSRFGVMFFADPEEAFRNLRSALTEGGRICFLCWQAVTSNPWMLVPLQAAAKHVQLPPPPAPGTPGPFSFADAERVRGILEAAGFCEIGVEPLESRLTLAGSAPLAEAVSFVVDGIGPTASILREQPERRDAVLAEVTEALAPYAGSDGVGLPCSAWIVTAER